MNSIKADMLGVLYFSSDLDLVNIEHNRRCQVLTVVVQDVKQERSSNRETTEITSVFLSYLFKCLLF